MELIRKKRSYPVCRLQRAENGVEFLTFPGLENTNTVRHLCTTREGGVSSGIFRSMNLSYIRGDTKENVDENFRRAAQCLGCSTDDMVCTDQTHTVNIRIATQQDRGKGITRERDFTDIDGLITAEQGVVLAGFFADCVPLLFVDPVKKVIGIAHSGWRGTVGEIGKHMVEKMQEGFGCDPADLHVAIGPSICQDCYEVSEDVIEVVRNSYEEAYWSHFFREKEGTVLGKQKKYQLDLWELNRQILLWSKIPEDHIEVTDLCTCCNPEVLFSHRASHGKRGNLGAFITLK